MLTARCSLTRTLLLRHQAICSSTVPLLSVSTSAQKVSNQLSTTKQERHEHYYYRQHRPYSSTVPVLRRKEPDFTEEEIAKFFDPPKPDGIQTINCDDMTKEEIQKLVDDALASESGGKVSDRNWIPGTRKRPLMISNNYEDLLYEEDDFNSSKKWSLLHKRCGALGIKVGMTPLWDDWGNRLPCTVVYMDHNVVMEVKTRSQHGYDAVVLGAGERKLKRVTKPLRGHYDQVGLAHPPAKVREFRIVHGEAPTPGTLIHARHFVPGQNVDVAGISKGKGFQGAMKRHNFKGMPASHGVSKSHRSLGSTGQCQDPGKVFKGKKMAGRMGGERVTVQNLRVVKVDRGRNLLYLLGAVPGQKGNWVEIRDAVKNPLWGTDLIEGGAEVTKPPLPTFAYEEGIDGCGKVGFEQFMPVSDNDPYLPRDVETFKISSNA